MNLSNISAGSPVSDLDWYFKSFKPEDQVIDIINYFNSDKSSNGVIIQNNASYKLLSKQSYNKITRNPYFTFPGQTINNIYNNINSEATLVVPHNMPISNVIFLAIQRKEQFRYDPVMIKFDDGAYGIVDFQSLVLALLESFTVSESKLQENTEFKNDIVGILTHDLRNVLNTIQGFAWIIEEDYCSRDEAKEYAAFIKNASRQISILLLKMLHSFSEETTEIRIYKTNFDIEALLREIIMNFEAEVGMKQQILTLKFKNVELKRDLHADKTGMFEILQTLISNAIKFTDIGGKILVTLAYSPNTVKISIKDSGRGMSKEDIEKLFKKYERISSDPTAGQISIGLDLYISQKIINMHNGCIHVKSEIGKGSVFSVEVPL
jgi:signal transduction histidine kinase